jgi:hypothetical protein
VVGGLSEVQLVLEVLRLVMVVSVMLVTEVVAG